MEGIAFAIYPLFILIALIGAASGLVLWFLYSYGVFKLAKNLGLSRPWLAFIPIASSYIYGKVADTSNGNDKIYRNILLALSCVVLGMSFLKICFSFGFFGQILELMKSFKDNFDNSADVFNEIKKIYNSNLTFGAVAIFSNIGDLVNLAYRIVFAYVSNRLFTAYGSSSPLLLAILGFFFPIVTCVYIFVIRNEKPKSAVNYE